MKLLSYETVVGCVFVAILAASVAGCTDKSFDEELKAAEEKVALDESVAAMSAYQGIAKRFPNDARRPGILFRIADIYENAIGDDGRAAEGYDLLAKEYPFSEAAVAARERHARLMEKKGNFDSAIEDYSALLKHFPESADKNRYILLLAGAYVAQRNFPQARTELKPILEDPAIKGDVRESALFITAESFFLEDKAAEALAYYEQLLEEFPKSKLAAEARLHMAMCVEEMGYLGTARDITKEAMRDYPNKDVVKKRLESIDNRGKK